MTLKPEDTALFYELFLPLLNYVNHHYHVTENIGFTGKSVDPAKAMEVARFLWEQPSIIDVYINENIFVRFSAAEQAHRRLYGRLCCRKRNR